MITEKDMKSLETGNLEVFSKLYDKYVKNIYDFLYYKTFDVEVSEDLTQDTFMKALKKIGTFEGKTENDFKSWIYKIAYNNFLDYLRTKKDTLEIDDATNASYDNKLNENIDDRSKIDDVLDFLDTLPKDHKDIILMRIWDDLSYKEISQLTNKSIDNCKKIVSRTLMQIQSNISYLFFLCFINNI